MKKLLLAPVLMIYLVFFSSCSGSPPSLEEIKWRVVLRDDGSNQYEQLMVYMRFSDPDGENDPARAIVTADGTGLLWQSGRDEWSSDSTGGRWWGLPPMMAASGSSLPNVRYTLRLEDLAGDSSELQFRPDPDRPGPDELVWPEVELNGNELQLESVYPGAILFLRNIEGEMIETYEAENGLIIQTDSADTWEFWIPGDNTTRAFLYGPFEF